MYIKSTNKEVCLGDEVTYTVRIKFSKYPELVLENDISATIDKEIMNSLIEAEVVEKREAKTKEKNYNYYLKWLADKQGYKYEDVLKHFNFTLDLNPTTALSMLLKTISKEMLNNCYSMPCVNGYVSRPNKVWIFNTTIGKSAIIDVTKDTNLKGIAYFLTKEDLDKALEVCKPILERIYDK
jgi:hypothetical protein